MATIKVGDRVKWAVPEDKNDAANRFIVAEVNDDRCFVVLVCDWFIKPNQLARCSDLVLADD